MQRVSSQLTIVLRIVIPTIWFTSIASLVTFLLWAVSGKAGLFGNPFLWVGLLIILVTGYLIIHLVLWRFFRIDMDDHYVYVTNYFKTFKYPLADIASITSSKLLPGRMFTIHLKAKGTFGKDIRFLASQVLWNDYLSTHAKVKALLVIDQMNMTSSNGTPKD